MPALNPLSYQLSHNILSNVIPVFIQSILIHFVIMRGSLAYLRAGNWEGFDDLWSGN